MVILHLKLTIMSNRPFFKLFNISNELFIQLSSEFNLRSFGSCAYNNIIIQNIIKFIILVVKK